MSEAISSNRPPHLDALERLLSQGLWREAEAEARARCRRDPHDAGAWFGLGAACHGDGRPAEALEAFRRAVREAPDHAQAHNACAGLLGQAGRVDEAIAAYRSALFHVPHDAEILVNLGLVLADQDRHGEALELLDRALRVRPDTARALAARSDALARLDRGPEALRDADVLALRHAGSAETHACRAGALLAVGRFEAARRAARRALDIDPGHRRASARLGRSLAALGRLEEAALVLAEVAAAGAADRPDGDARASARLRAWTLYLHAGHEALCRGDWHDYARYARRFGSAARGIEEGLALRDPGLPFRLRSLPVPEDAQAALARSVGEGVAQSVPQAERCRRHGPRDGPVRIGYLSGNLREHVVAHTVRALFEHHDRTRFEVLAYALGADDGSAIRARIADLADGFIDLSGLRDAAAAERINADGVELLVDLDGYTTGARPGVLARRPAPVQLVYQGYWGPLGAGLVDYVVSGVRSTPRQALEGWDESCVLLPGAAIVYGYREDQQYRPTRAACGLPEQATVLACFSRTYKIDPEVYAVWMRALHAAPQAVLWLMADGPEVPQNLRREAVRRGVDPGRILFARWCPPHEHVARCALADVFLDTLHFGGHTTALDALWAGVPLVSCRGEGPYGRIGAAVLEEAGLDELAVDGLGNYEALALRLATDDAYRHVVRGRAAIARAGPLFDERRRVRHVEAALAAVSSRHRLGQPPADLVVAEDGATRPLGA